MVARLGQHCALSLPSDSALHRQHRQFQTLQAEPLKPLQQPDMRSPWTQQSCKGRIHSRKPAYLAVGPLMGQRKACQGLMPQPGDPGQKLQAVSFPPPALP